MTNAPSATFILVSYNQEDTIEASTRAALAQVGEPLEIILSDDASSDRTYDIMQRVAGGYDGPHHVTVRQNPENLGVNTHVKRVLDLASHDFLIWAAGDDISLPQRAHKILQAYRDTSAKLIHSDAQTRRPDGSPGTQEHRKALLYRDHFTMKEAATSFALYLGATAAWHRDLHQVYGGFPQERAHEDLILGFRAVLENSLHYIPEELVIYRQDAGIASQLSRNLSKLDNRARRAAILKGQITVLQQRLKDTDTFGLATDHPVRHAMEKLRDRFAMRLSYYEGDKARFARHPLRLVHALTSEWLRDRRNR